MIRALLLVIYFFVILFFSAFDDTVVRTPVFHCNEILVEETNKRVVEFRLNKNKISGYGAIQITLPEDATVTGQNSAGAVFSRHDEVAQWRWMELPDAGEITLMAEITTPDKDYPFADLDARFLYTEANKKRVEHAPGAMHTKHSLSVAGEDDIEVSCSRTVSPGARKGEINVQLKILKGATTGFARYSDELPKGMRVESVVTDGSSFSVADGKVRFVWVTVPIKEVLFISYVLSGKTKGEIKLNGEYSYVEANKTRKFTLPSETFDMSEAVGGGEEPAISPPAKKEIAGSKTSAKNKVATGKKGSGRDGTKAGVRKADLEFRVQVGAFRTKKVTASALQRKFWIGTDIISEMHEGFSKFMTGRSVQYAEAHDLRERMREEHGVKSAFVVAYNHGKRITVQEALMISNQKWFK